MHTVGAAVAKVPLPTSKTNSNPKPKLIPNYVQMTVSVGNFCDCVAKISTSACVNSLGVYYLFVSIN